MNIDVKSDESYLSRNAALVMSGPFDEVKIGNNTSETMLSTLSAIFGYIENCLEFSANPLPHLRRYFPRHTWKFHKPNTRAEVAKIVDGVDYALLAHPYDDWSMGIFTVTDTFSAGAKDRKRICFKSEEGGACTLYGWPYRELKTVGALILFENIKDPDFDGRYMQICASCDEVLALIEKQSELRRRQLAH
jgi:hypothetical protein